MTTDNTELGGLSTNADYIADMDVGERRDTPSGMTSKRETYWMVMADIAKARMEYGVHWHTVTQGIPSIKTYASKEAALTLYRWVDKCADTECMKAVCGGE